MSADWSTQDESTEEALLRKHLKDLHHVQHQWIGYVHTDVELQNFERDLAKINVSFQTEKSSYKSNIDTESKLMYSTGKGALPVSLPVPFKVVSQVRKGCVYGRERHGVRKSSEDKGCHPTPDWAPELFKKKNFKLQCSKKKGCTASMYIKKIETYPEYKIDLQARSSRRSRHAAKKTALSNLSEALSKDPPAVQRETRLYVSISEREAHINHSFSQECRSYHSYVPEYLHNRPRKVIKHVMSRLATAADYSLESIQLTDESGVFYVRSMTCPTTFHRVAFAPPSCSCIDFLRHSLPCKHFCAIFLLVNDWGFTKLPESYRNGPLMSLDCNVLCTEADYDVQNVEISTGSLDCNVFCTEADYDVQNVENSTGQPLGTSRQGEVSDLDQLRQCTMGSLRAQLFAELEKCRSMAYNCTNVEEMQKAIDSVKTAQSFLHTGTPSVSGIGVRGSPVKGCSGQKQRPKSSKALSVKRLRRCGQLEQS
uniref:SWIM-type domain-containing protein n=1 Tax=Ixodes ricinus TaxID=34613 RepID=A0A147BI71_IXORI